MSLKCMKRWLSTWALILVLAPAAYGQGLEDFQLFAPVADGTFGGGPRPRDGFFFSAEWLRMSISDPETTPIGFETDLPTDVYTSFFAKHPARNDFNTGFLDAKFTSGMRYEFGDIRGHHGWFFSGFLMRNQSTEFSPQGGGELIIEDPANWGQLDDDISADLPAGTPYGRTYGIFFHEIDAATTELKLAPMPVRFDELKMSQETKTWGLELNYLFRMHPTRHGSVWEVFGGVRYLEFQDKFGIAGRGSPFDGVTVEYPDPLDVTTTTGTTTGGTTTTGTTTTGTTTTGTTTTGTTNDTITYSGTPTGPNSIFHDANWETKANSHVIGPQIGIRYSKQVARWSVFAEGRFFAGFNRQNISQSGVFGSEIGSEEYQTLLDGIAIDEINTVPIDPPLYPWTPYDMSGPITFNHVSHADEWSPGVELRLGAKWQLTDAISIQAAYNAIWIDGIARAANMTDYSFNGDVFGINMDQNRQDVWMNAFSIGAVFNR